MSPWPTVSRHQLTEGRFISAFRDEVLVAEGVTGSWEWVDMADAVRVVAVDGEGRIALVEDEFYLQRRRLLLVPGGGVERTEEPAAAARRELEEETGWRAGRLEPLGVVEQLPTATPARAHLFLARELTPGRLAREASEAGMTLSWRPLDEAVAAVREGVVTEAGSVSAILLAALSLKA
ncbi:NUDIX domain-containing protein [Streptacidiphilus carbonis]|jgi:8-oxo-dGTP pyrophosphatase MutT (NUDIX family)|uniref:NUDIX domain-containing protein n=1 Tax=Streptacidiphilus carbonis TaxID=105422 RepID=UPI0005A8A034|nr:NUDIX hydrolase [Streptacidiphilus carbonis]